MACGWRKRRTIHSCHWRMPPLRPRRISLGTAIAVAFPRSPIETAKAAWDLAANSKGRFILGLGTQIKPHITKRFSARWGKPVAQLCDYIAALRVCWSSFQSGCADLPTTASTTSSSTPSGARAPVAMPFSEIPIYIAGVNTGLARLAGEQCQGFHVHSFHTVKYLQRDSLAGI